MTKDTGGRARGCSRAAVEAAASDVQPSRLTQREHGKGKMQDPPRRRAS